MTYQECDFIAHVEDSLRTGDFEIMADFGWSYPPGVTDADIDAAVGADDDDNHMLQAYEEWAGEAHQHLTAMYTYVALMFARGVIKNEDATFLFKEIEESQDWLENILMPSKEDHQQV
jgi:hypothetical protein